MEFKEVASENKLKEMFLNVLNSGEVKTVFQPIISLRDGTTYGYEALSRGPEDSELNSPETLFRLADECNTLWELELLCRSKALQAAYNMRQQIRIFLNVNPNIMHDIKFRQGFTKEYLKSYLMNPEDVIFEINEKAAINNIMDFKKTVDNYKDQNYKIAIDDAGAGYSGLNMISDIHPHYIKLDMNLIRDIDKDYTKQALVKSMVEFSKLSNTQLIAEGIETERELIKLIEIGVHYGQGFFIQRPAPNIQPISGDITNVIYEINMRKNHLVANRLSDIYIGNISTAVRTLNPSIQVYHVNQMMKEDPRVPGYCIVEDGFVKGVITRESLSSELGGQYGYSLNYKKNISDIMSRDYMQADYQTPIDLVAKTAMQREQEKLYDFITITKEEKYYGIVTVKDLLEKTIEIEVANAKHLNPLSELPGNPLIEKHLEFSIQSQQPFCVLYFDIDNFKTYNDVYGFEKGDMVIRQLTKILKDVIPSDEFIGHIGGDDFIAVLQKESPEQICEQILTLFDRMSKRSYSEADQEKGYILTKNRHGVEESFPLMSMSIAAVRFNRHHCKSIYELSEKASNIKKKCKLNSGSSCIIEDYIETEI
jgi:EAL domain-containing protein (putative c-di-GMP-specific phosphodiesterase class I)/GGDEF domain-containing protein